MARRGVKKRDYEKLDDATIGRVVSLLEAENPITKKAACETLCISYNTKRLGSIIQEYKDNIAFRKKRYAATKGTPFSELELQELVTDYLCGESMVTIANNLYRSIHIVKRKISELHLPERTKDSSYWNPEMIPDEMVSQVFDLGELVWSARYNAVAEVSGILHEEEGAGDTVYRIWVFGKTNEFAYQPWWELGKLEVVKRFNLQAEKFVKTDKPNFRYRIE
jgi:hypothetical protein